MTAGLTPSGESPRPAVPPRTPPPLPADVPGQVDSPAQRLSTDLRSFVLTEPAVYTWWHPLHHPDRRAYRLVVPDSFDHDFASVPRVLWALISPFDLGLASIFHDWLYRNGGEVETLEWKPGPEGWEPVGRAWTRHQADDLFARIMREQAVPRWRRRWAWRAVRLLGRDAWWNPS